MSIGSILSSIAQSYPSVMQSTPASATTNAVQPSAAQSGSSFQQALSNITGSTQSGSTARASGASPAAKVHHGGHPGGGGSSSSQASTLLSTLSSLAGPSLDISV